jgi:phosphoribosylformylglycinamidine synthase
VVEETLLKSEIETRRLAMSLAEAKRLAAFVGRCPTPLEFHLFDTMWSEHCSYKSSKRLLSTLPVSSSQVVLGPGEDAGVVKLCEHEGIQWDLVVAHESHNHPSQVLPVEGAATGIGGIVRDVYCMGADVVGVLDLLRFGDPEGEKGERVRSIVRGVVEGIWKYGNALGVPNLGGDTVFYGAYDDNCLVNVVALGLARDDRIVHSFVPDRAREEKYVLILVGKPTDDTGFGGATFASAQLAADDELEAVQVADPFLKRILAEANRAVQDFLHAEEAEFGFKDLGAGGLACVSSEMAAHSGMGITVELCRVPVSLEDLPAEVVACAETQERFGLAVPSSLAEEVTRIYNEDYELPRLFPGARAEIVGTFTAEPVYRVVGEDGEIIAEAPASSIVEGVSYTRDAEPGRTDFPEPSSRPCDPEKDMIRILTSVAGCSRSHVWSYYDSEVRGNTHLRPGESDAVVIRPLPGCGVGLAISGDGNPFICELDPYNGGAHAVGEAVRNVVASGATPICATDCLNFGSPEDPEVFWQFGEAIRGISDACKSLGLLSEEPLPIVSGNVSFYNESAGGVAIPPSPVVCVAGRLDSLHDALDISLKRPGNSVIMLGERRDQLGGSLYYRECLGHRGGQVPLFDGRLEREMARFVLDFASGRLSTSVRLVSCHDISEGGLLLALVEMALASGFAASLGASLHSAEPDPVFLYSESPGYVLELEGEISSLELPPFASVLGVVDASGSISGEGFSVELSEGLLQRSGDRLASLVWREEGTQ